MDRKEGKRKNRMEKKRDAKQIIQQYKFREKKNQ